MAAPTNALDRAQGVLLGLAAGDRNCGPQRMALRLAESLRDCNGFNEQDVVRRYLAWFLGPPHDTERAFDTGPTFDSVFTLVEKGMNAREAAKKVDQKRRAPGVNPAHRNVVLAASHWIQDKELSSFAEQETQLTHLHPSSIRVSVASNVLIRRLIKGEDWNTARQCPEVVAALPMPGIPKDILFTSEEAQNYISSNGAAYDVLLAALYFVSIAHNPLDAIELSIGFAGPANYCPVLVGSLAGARWGASAVKIFSKELFGHVTAEVLERIEGVNKTLQWP